MENSISEKRRSKPEWYALRVLIVSTFVLLLCSLFVGGIYYIVPSLGERTPYFAQLLVDLLGFIYVYFLIDRLGYRKIYKEHKLGLIRGCIVGGYFLVVGGINVFSQLIGLQGLKIQPVPDIIIFVLTMLFIGLTEEFLCRGVIVNLLIDRYGKSAAGVKYTVVVSGILFGLFHLSNAISGVIEFTGVLVQVIITSTMGMLLAAIYLRSKNIWVVVLLHAFIDFAGLLGTGIYSQGTLQETISSYSPVNLLAMIPYLVATCFLLRSSKMRDILDITENSEMKEQNENEASREIVEDEENKGRQEENENEASLENQSNVKTISKLNKVLIGYGLTIVAITFLLVIQNSLLSKKVIFTGSGSYYDMDAISTFDIPNSGKYEFLIEAEDIGYPVVVDVVITDSNQKVIASNLDTYTRDSYTLDLDKGSYTISAYIIGDQKTLQEHVELGLYPYDDEEVARLMQTLPEEQPESYGVKITKKVTLK